METWAEYVLLKARIFMLLNVPTLSNKTKTLTKILNQVQRRFQIGTYQLQRKKGLLYILVHGFGYARLSDLHQIVWRHPKPKIRITNNEVSRRDLWLW